MLIDGRWLDHLRPGGRLVVLLEDKIGAAFQPEQGTRYRERAASYIASGRASRLRQLDPPRGPQGTVYSTVTFRDWPKSSPCWYPPRTL